MVLAELTLPNKKRLPVKGLCLAILPLGIKIGSQVIEGSGCVRVVLTKHTAKDRQLLSMERFGFDGVS